MQNLEGCKIWIGEDRELSAKIQEVAFKAGWTWGRSFGGTVLKPGKIRFIKFESYGGERRIFSGHSGESDREGFDSCPNMEIYASAMGIVHRGGACNTQDPGWLPLPGEKVKLVRYEAIDEYETASMKEKLVIGGIYEVHETDINFRQDDGNRCIHLVENGKWYLASAFVKAEEYDAVVKVNDDKELLDQLKQETAEITASRFPTLPKKGDYIILNSTSNTKVFDRANAAAMEKELTIGSSYKILEIDPHWSLYNKDNSPSVRIKYDSGSDSCWCSLADFVPSITIDIETTPTRKYVEVTRNTKIKVGDTLRITDKPLTWNSLFSSNSPMDIDYPIEVVVEKYSDNYGGTFLAGGFGWCLEGLIKKGCVKLIENPVAGLISTHFSDAPGMVQTLGRTARQDPTNIKVEGVNKAAPVPSRVTVSPLKMVNVPLAFPIKTKTIDRVTTKSNPIQI
jgi:hypothetical protein